MNVTSIRHSAQPIAEAKKMIESTNDTATKYLYLSFDDGPLFGTSACIAICENENVKASFFQIGLHQSRSNWGKKLYNRILSRPDLFLLSNHSFTHTSGKYVQFYNQPDSALADFIYAADVLKTTNNIVRLPGNNGWRTDSIQFSSKMVRPLLRKLDSAGFNVIGWDIEWQYTKKGRPIQSAAFMAKQILATYNIHIPIVTTLHGTDITLVGKDLTYKPVVTFSINQSDGVTAVSEDLKKSTYDHFEIKKDIRVIPNFIDHNRFSLKPKDHFKKAIAPQNEKILVHTSNFRKVKRTQDVVHIFQRILEKVPAKLLMVGDGPERVICEQLCRDLKVCEHVRFLGKQDAVEEILSVADLFIMPSESESFGLAALEAMACKVPVISTNTGGLPELNIDGVTGFMNNVGDIDGMAKNAIYILQNDERLLSFKENALKRANDFDLDKILPQYVNFYKEVIEASLATFS